MLTRYQLKRQRAAQEALHRTKASVAQSLSSSLLLYLMRFLDDFKTLGRMQSVCSSWRSLSNGQLDVCWRPMYLRDWEAESSTSPSVLTSGDATPWKERYRNRMTIESNWHAGNCRFTNVVMPKPFFAF